MDILNTKKVMVFNGLQIHSISWKAKAANQGVSIEYFSDTRDDGVDHRWLPGLV